MRILDDIAQFAGEVERGWGVGGFGVRVGVDTGLVACIPLVYGRSMAIVKPWVTGWREFGKTSANFADLVVRRG